MEWTIRSVLSWSKQYLDDKGIETPRIDTEVLLAKALGIKRIGLYLDMDRPLIKDELGAYRELLRRRAQKEPTAYILGEKEFYSRSFLVNKHVLIPRPETEILVEQAIQRAPQNGHILELGVGSGAAIISVLAEREDLTGIGSDISAQALAVAQENAQAHGVAARVRFFVGKGFSAMRAQFPLIIMNPPYISLEEAKGLQEDVILYEPHSSLFGGNDGLDIIKEILMNVRDHLSSGGVFVMETGYRQKDAVEDLVRSIGGIRSATWVKDFSGIERIIVVESSDG